MELNEARERLDRIDKGMLELLERRMEVVSHIARYKEAHGMPVSDAAREKEILDALGTRVDGEFLPYATLFIENLLRLSCDYQTHRRENNLENR